MSYIPTALSPREDATLRRYARDKLVIEAGALLGHSTIQLATAARRVISIDRHTGYDYWRNDTLQAFCRNLAIAGVAGKVTLEIGPAAYFLPKYEADFAFIDLCGTYQGTLAAIRAARAPLIGVHDFERQSCPGVALAVKESAYQIRERIDSLVILERSE